MKTCPTCSFKNNADGMFCSVCGGVLNSMPEATVDYRPAESCNTPPLLPDSDLSAHARFLPGTEIAGRYRIVHLAGRGGMGEVYRADDLKLGHPVALKFLPRDVSEGSRRFQLFLSEVRLSRQIAHPNVCRVYDIGEAAGQHFLSMEYIDGEDLKRLLRRKGHLSSDSAIAIAHQLCAGLAAAHEKGIVHRDLKPANIMIDWRGEARITDFGLACLADASGGTNEVAGTPAYMAPEQLARGETTTQSDLYSLGLILHEIFTGQQVFRDGSLQEVSRAHEAFSPRPLSELVSDIDEAIERAILSCLHKDPHQRPPSARVVASALTAGETVSTGSMSYESKSGGGRSVAVLPFVNMSPDQENDFLSDGITEDLILAFSRVKGLRVPARTSSFAFKGKNEDIRRIGQLLNVEAVLEGSVRKSGNKLRVTAQLIQVRGGFHLWSERYDREMKDVFEIQDEIARAIVEALEVQLGSQARTKRVRTLTASTDAYEFYVKGRHLWNQRGLGLKKALHCFELALLEDPNYALAWSGLADTYELLGDFDFLGYREAHGQAKNAARKAVALDDDSAEAHTSWAVARSTHDWDLFGAEQHFQKALELNPNYMPARYYYAWMLLAIGRDEESLDQTRLGLEVDPLSKLLHAIIGWSLLDLGRVAEALSPVYRSLELDPNYALGRWLLGGIYWMQGRTDSALVEYQRAAEVSGRGPWFLSTLGWALALSGEVGQARQIQGELTQRKSPAPTRPLFLARLHAVLGENDLAFIALEQAVAEREHLLLRLILRCGLIELQGLESDPRWATFVRNVKETIQAASSVETANLAAPTEP